MKPSISISVSVTAALIPQQGDNPIVIDQLAVTDNITYLMAAAAARTDTTSVKTYGGTKHAWLHCLSNQLRNWSSQLLSIMMGLLCGTVH